jgi:hypothetical protein
MVASKVASMADLLANMMVLSLVEKMAVLMGLK